MFSLDATRCVGACGLAPVAILDDQVYGNANNNKDLENAIRRIIKEENINQA
jgi:NADH:ubiquinone oxidoreductase subunit E